MLRVIVGLFLIAHGLIHAGVWVAPMPPDAPFKAGHSWILGDSRGLAITLALVAGVGFVVAGIGFLSHQDWWGVMGIAAGAVSLVLMAMYFNPWLSVGILISAGVVFAAVQALQRA